MQEFKRTCCLYFLPRVDRLDEGIESAEKAVIGYGGVQMGLLEKTFLGCPIYCFGTDAWIHGDCHWDDLGI